MQIKATAHRLQFVIVVLSLTILFCLPTQGQVKGEDVFDSIPASLRVRLVERLKLVVEYQHEQKWEELYGLLSELYTQGESKEKFAKRFSHLQAQGLINKLIDFTPKSVAVHNESADYGEWTIFGCAKLSERGQIMSLYASVTAWREKGDWFFSDIGVITPIDGNATRCPY